MSRLATTREQLSAEGYVFLPKFAPELPPRVAFSWLGSIDSVEGLAEIQVLTPQTETASTPNTYSGNFGTSEFPLHTDLAHWAVPPRYIALRCLSGTKSVTTSVLDSLGVVQAVGRETLRMAIVQPRRPLKNGKHLLRLLEKPINVNSDRIRWDTIFLKPSNEFAAATVAGVRDALRHAQPVQFTLRDPGDTLVLDNWRVFHGRSPVSSDELQREIARAYLGVVD